jgi:hypothetical protein
MEYLQTACCVYCALMVTHIYYNMPNKKDDGKDKSES